MALGLPSDAEVWAERIGTPGRPARRYPNGRVCAQEGCATVLSTYNGGNRCALHNWEHVGTGVDRRPGSRARRLARSRRTRVPAA